MCPAWINKEFILFQAATPINGANFIRMKT